MSTIGITDFSLVVDTRAPTVRAVEGRSRFADSMGGQEKNLKGRECRTCSAYLAELHRRQGTDPSTHHGESAENAMS
jgi:hypothetical protein